MAWDIPLWFFSSAPMVARRSINMSSKNQSNSPYPVSSNIQDSMVPIRWQIDYGSAVKQSEILPKINTKKLK